MCSTGSSRGLTSRHLGVRSARVATSLFDPNIGADRIRELPCGPGVYLFRDASGRVLYAGRAKDLRRRLAGYRTASRRKAQRKMRTLVREAASLEVRPRARDLDSQLCSEGTREAGICQNVCSRRREIALVLPIPTVRPRSARFSRVTA
jgi:hypothetical protein